MVEAAGIEPDVDGNTYDALHDQEACTSATVTGESGCSSDDFVTETNHVESTLKQKKCEISVQRETESIGDQIILNGVERLPDLVKYMVLNWDKFPRSVKQEIIDALAVLDT
jgi:hypothetical protein